jgi:hypothetical protein
MLDCTMKIPRSGISGASHPWLAVRVEPSAPDKARAAGPSNLPGTHATAVGLQLKTSGSIPFSQQPEVL